MVRSEPTKTRPPLSLDFYGEVVYNIADASHRFEIYNVVESSTGPLQKTEGLLI